MDKKIRVLQVLSTLNQGGAENLVMNLYRVIDRSQIQFDFIVHTDEQGAFDAEVESLGGVIYHAPRYTGLNHFQYARWWKLFLITHPEYQILHSHIRSYASIYIPIAKKHGLKTIIHSHNTSNGRGFISVVKMFLQYPLRHQADYLFACSIEAGKWLFGKKVVDKDNFRVICNGIDCGRFKFSEANRILVRKKLGMESNFIVGHIGRHCPQKNPLFLIEIFAELYKRDHNARLLQLGQGEMTERMMQRCHELGIADVVVFAGVHNDVEKYYSAMDVFCFPSLWEGLPLTLIEAQTSGLYCVTADTMPQAANIGAGLFEQLSLEQSDEEWARALIVREGRPRAVEALDITRQVGYDICNIAYELQIFYGSVVKMQKE